MLAQNTGKLDRALRILAGLALLAAFFALPDLSLRPLLLIGIVPLATGLLGSCPAYSLFGISTCKSR